MARHAFIGFLDEENGRGLTIKGTDPDFRELIRLFYCIPGCGTYGVSCSGHFIPDWDEETFYPMPWGHLGLAVTPQKEHILQLLNIIYEHTQQDPDAYISIQEKGVPPFEFKKYNPSIDLEPFSQWKTKDGLYVPLLEIRLGDNGCLDSVPDNYCDPVDLEGNEEAFEKSKQRCSEIQLFWKSLEDKVRAYNHYHSFSQVNFKKEEFHLS